jgi:HEAT repeat protein
VSLERLLCNNVLLVKDLTPVGGENNMGSDNKTKHILWSLKDCFAAVLGLCAFLAVLGDAYAIAASPDAGFAGPAVRGSVETVGGSARASASGTEQSPKEKPAERINSPANGRLGGRPSTGIAVLTVKESYEMLKVDTLSIMSRAVRALLEKAGYDVVETRAVKAPSSYDAALVIEMSGSVIPYLAGVPGSKNRVRLVSAVKFERNGTSNQYEVPPATAEVSGSVEESYELAIVESQLIHVVADIVAKPGKPDGRELLMAVLEDQKQPVDIRVWVAQGLGGIADPAVAKSLGAVLRDPNAESSLKVQAVKSLGMLGSAGVEDLSAALLSEKPLIRFWTIRSLGQTKDVRAAELLASLLDDKDSTTRTTAAITLGQMGKVGIVPVCKGLVGSHHDVQEITISILAEAADPSSIEPLAAVLGDPKSGIHVEAAIALGKFKDIRAVRALVTALKADPDKMGLPAAGGLAMIGPRAVEPLLEILADKDTRIQILAAKTLGGIGDERAVQPLSRMAQDAADPAVKRAAEESLKMLKEHLEKARPASRA